MNLLSKFSSQTQKLLALAGIVTILLYLTMCQGMSFSDIGKSMVDHKESKTERLTEDFGLK